MATFVQMIIFSFFWRSLRDESTWGNHKFKKKIFFKKTNHMKSLY